MQWQANCVLFVSAITALLNLGSLVAAETSTIDKQAIECVVYRQQLLSVNCQNQSLKDVLDQIARDSGLRIAGTIENPENIALSFKNLPLDRALARLLRDRSFVLYYNKNGAPLAQPGDAAVATLWLLDEVRDRGATVRDLSELASNYSRSGFPHSIAQLKAALSYPDFEVREAALADLANIGSLEAQQTMRQALQDNDPEIRLQSLQAFAELGGDYAEQALRIAHQDPSAEVRRAASDWLDALLHDDL